MLPRITFETSKVVNEFCHVSVLYAEHLPSELADGMLGNKAYRQQYASFKRNELLHELQKAGQISASSWYSLARLLMRSDNPDVPESRVEDFGPVSVFLKVLRQGLANYDQIWEKTRLALEDYTEKFRAAWSPIGDRVLTNLSTLAKREWTLDEFHVHFVDCLWGGFAWVDCVAFAPFPDMEVQKKFLTHELSELTTQQSLVSRKLKEAGLDDGIAHTVVDMLAYFSVKDFIAKPVFPHPERKGIVPNPNYYPAVTELYPLFERYSKNPEAYSDFDSFLSDMVLELKKP